MLGANIANYRKKMGMTQEQLAQKLDVTNQAVSKWETDQSCPDTLLLPKIADVFEISLDALFGRAEPPRQEPKAAPVLPWEDDKAFHVVLYHGHTLIGSQPEKADLTFTYEGPAKDIYCSLNLSCGDVEGNVNVEGYAECGDVGGSVNAGSYVECGDVNGNVNAGGYVECSDVNGNVMAGAYVECSDVGGNVSGGSYVECGDVEGSVTALSHVECGDVGGSVTSENGNADSGEGKGFRLGDDHMDMIKDCVDKIGKIFPFGKK